MSHIHIFFDEISQMTWCCRIVREGERYGLIRQQNADGHGTDTMACINDGGPMVEFYDCRYPHTRYGQFVSRYYIKSLFERDQSRGLCLDGGVYAWQVSGPCMVKVIEWLEVEA